MGIAINYKGSITDLSMIDKLQKEMVDFSKAMNWKYRLWSEDQSKPFDAKLLHTEKGSEIKGHIPLKGITIVIDKDNGGLDLLFNPERKLTSFLSEIMIYDGTIKEEHRWESIKTQFGAVDSHIAIVKILQHVREKYIPDLDVIDEGEYWETNDREHLMGKRAFLAGKIAQFSKTLSSVKFKGEPTAEDVAKKIEEVFHKMNKNKK